MKIKAKATVTSVFTMLVLCASAVHGAIYNVDAAANCAVTSPLATISLVAGESFTVSADPSDLWSFGAVPRWCNADGLTGNLYATGSDESGQPAGTLIGIDFGLYSQANLSAPYGSLVGEIGNNYFLVGTDYSGVTQQSGVLYLMGWDFISSDNSGQIAATVTVVPEPDIATFLLLGIAVAAWRWIRRSQIQL